MSSLEIIHLRSFGSSLETSADRIRQLIPIGASTEDIVTVYRRQGIATDVAIHIRHAEPTATSVPSTFAIHLASALRDLGYVEHSLWNEIDESYD